MTSRTYYLPAGDTERRDWLVNFNTKLSVYATTLNIEPAVVTQVNADTLNFTQILTLIDSYRDYNKQLTAYKNILRSEPTTTGAITDLPQAPAIPVLPANPQSDIFGRITKLVNTIKNHPSYNNAIGQDLDIIGTEEGIDLTNIKPILTHEFNAARPVIKWKKDKLQGIKIFVNRGTGFQFLAVDTQPDYTDTHPLPPIGQSEVWRYKAVYILNDEEVGQYSDDMVVTVIGAL